jgi:hypothetical protein
VLGAGSLIGFTVLLHTSVLGWLVYLIWLGGSSLLAGLGGALSVTAEAVLGG